MVFKIPKMEKEEYDKLIMDNYLSRIAFSGLKYPYIAPFLYIFDGKNLYFLSTKYGRKIDFLNKNPYVSVEIENYSKNMSCYKFITIQGKIILEEDLKNMNKIKEKFVEMIISKKLSTTVLEALGHNKDEPVNSLVESDNTYVWKLVDVNDIVALKNSN
ncbi:conserved hypothetical protein [Methanococcus vannielii SB]|uniref:Pyridoxamine 5'-phosphate oxidase-related FMN-binding n=1 Tax=Methanococcus vannielii (strain ATCC 35089 / DSM 1224 / JCM 13029 / OCM 148 / SB) TaxID=406327 RepID=A6UNA8_METVS|nr:pyridoxamine 5'-phosphate oxidase family protein [Methanococcus vannielii]ABR53980.1 conserved hypothetical protein [Methanococcus vannielii SB]